MDTRPFPPPSVFAQGNMQPLAALLTGTQSPAELPAAEIADLISYARSHSVAPYLYWQLSHSDADLTNSVWDPLRAERDKQVRLYLRRKTAFQKIQAAFSAANISALWLKGWTLAHTVYPNPMLRPMRDLDVLVPNSDQARALTLLQSLGYVLDIPPHNPAMQEMWHHYHLHAEVAVELHYALIGLRSKILPPEHFARFLTQTRPVRYDDVTFTAFTPEVELLYECAHAILQHGETDFLLHRYLDLHLLITKSSALDWRLLIERAIELRWTYAVHRALELTQSYFGTPLPAYVLAELESRRPADESRDHAFEIQPDATRLETTRNLMRAMNARERRQWLIGSLLPSPAYMRWRYHLHSSWQLPLYYLYRWSVIAADALQTMLKYLRLK